MYADGTYSFQVLFVTLKTGVWKDTPSQDDMNTCLDTLLSNAGYLLCPGIENYESDFKPFIRFESKHLRCWNHPLKRYDSDSCLMWHKPLNEKKTNVGMSGVCRNCKKLHHDLSVLKNRAESASPGHKDKWTDPSSNRPMKYLSPDSRAVRFGKMTKERTCLRKSLSKFESMDINLLGNQHDEVCQLVSAIAERGKDDLEQIFHEAETANEGGGELLKQLWDRDIEDKKSFYEDQLKNSKCLAESNSVSNLHVNLISSETSNRWSSVTLRIGIIFYSTSTVHILLYVA